MYDWVGIGESNWVAIPVMILRGNVSFDHCATTTTREHDLVAEVIITHFWRDLSITVVRINEVGFVIVVKVWGQVFGREFLNR